MSQLSLIPSQRGQVELMRRAEVEVKQGISPPLWRLTAEQSLGPFCNDLLVYFWGGGLLAEYTGYNHFAS
jgi:hypothetical protein